MKKSKASGIIAFKTAEDAAAAVSDLRKEWSEEGRKVFIKNLHGTIDDKRLRQLFSQFGIITSARVIMDEEGKSKGFGFIGFSSPDEATEAITEMNGRTVCRKTLYVDLARGKKRTSWQIVDVQSSHQLAPQLNTLPSEKGNYRRTGSNKKKASISISKENTCSGKSKSLNIKQDSNKAAVHLPYQSTSSQNMLHLTRARLSSLVIPLPNNQKRKS